MTITEQFVEDLIDSPLMTLEGLMIFTSKYIKHKLDAHPSPCRECLKTWCLSAMDRFIEGEHYDTD